MSKILVIDDDAMITKLLQDFLTGEGHEVTAVHLGEEGVEFASANPPDLIICDVMLPDSTGFQLVDRFRQNPRTQAVPIIMMTGAARHPNQHQLGKMMGANEYILKPFNVDSVGDKVKYLLEHPEAMMTGSAEKEMPPVDPRLEQGRTALLDAVSAAEETPRLPERTPPPAALPAAPSRWKSLLSEPASAPLPSVPRLFAGRAAGLRWVYGMLLAHMLLTLWADIQAPLLQRGLLSACGHVLIGWGIRLGILVALCGLFKISLDSRQALRFMGWAMIPYVLQISLQVSGYRPGMDRFLARVTTLPMTALPELLAAMTLGVLLRSQPGGNYRKSVASMLIIAFLWTAAGRGYFYP